MATRVVHVSPYGMSVVSGITQVILTLRAHLASAGLEISVMCPSSSILPSEIPILALNLRSPWARNLELAIRTFFALLRHPWSADLVHCHQVHLQTLAALIAAKILGRPSIITCHVRPPARGRIRHGLETLMASIELRLASVAVAVSDRLRAEFPPARWVTIPNGVRVNDEPEVPRTPVELPRTALLEVVFVGRITRTKGIFTLLEAVSRSAKSRGGIRLTTYGPIESVGEYESAKSSLGLGSIVSDRGYDPRWRDKVIPGQVFALPSQYEGLPLSLLEAMAERMAVIATPVGGIPDVVIPNHTGILVPVEDAAHLAEAFEWLRSHPEERISLGHTAFRMIRDRFSAEEMAASYEKLYESLAGPR